MFQDMKADFLKFAVSGRFLAADGVAPQKPACQLDFLTEYNSSVTTET